MSLKKISVSGRSDVKAVAGSIAHILDTETELEISVIGAQALNQAVKAVTLARHTFHTPLNKYPLNSLVIMPEFAKFLDGNKENNEVSGIVLLVSR